MSLWTYADGKYRLTRDGAETLGGRAGQVISPKRLVTVRDRIVASHKADAARWTEQLVSGTLSLEQWTGNMQTMLRLSHGQNYVLARGGRDLMTQADWGRLGPVLRTQYQYLHGMAQEIADGKYEGKSAQVVINRIANRAALYAESSSSSFECGRLAAMGLDLSAPPQVPGDGRTRCLTNCRCHLDMQDGGDVWRIYWRMTPGESREDCVALGRRWNPLVLPK